MLFASVYPGLDLLVQHTERQATVFQHLIVKQTEVEFSAQRLLRALAQLEILS